MSQNNLAIILSGGLGRRFDRKLPKQFFKINDKYILEISVEKFIQSNLFTKIIVVTSLEFLDLTKEVLKNKKYKKEIVDKKRINIILKNIAKKSKQKGIDPLITKKIWKSMIKGFIDFEYKNFKKK